MRSVLYVAHRLSAPTREAMLNNGRTAALWCAWLCQNFDVATIADWIVMSSVLDETAENRALGLDCDVTLIPRCDALVHTGTIVSGGMELEAATAVRYGKPIADLTPLGVAVPTDERWLFEAVEKIFRPLGIWKARAA